MSFEDNPADNETYQIDLCVNEIKELKSQIAVLTEANKQLHDEAEVTDSLVLALQEEVKVLTAERDEAQAERDEARKELAELLIAPGIEEVNDCVTRSRDLGPTECRVEELAAIASRAISSRDDEKKRADKWQDWYEDENSERLIVEKERDEVVGLLKWCRDRFYTEFEEWSEDEESPEHEESNAILEIVEGK